MGSRGPKSAAEKLVVITGGRTERLAPPPDLPELQQTIWRDTVACEPVEFFDTKAKQDLLLDYVTQRAEIETMRTEMNAFDPKWLRSKEGLKRYHEYIKILDKLMSGAKRAATALRLTNTSRYTPMAAATQSKNVTKEKFPWEL